MNKVQNFYRPKSTQVIAASVTSASITTSMTTNTVVRIVADAAAFITIAPRDVGATATATDVLMPANVLDYFAVQEGDDVAAITASGTANVYVTEMTQ